jgi:ribulose-phosphate 3-epimerase
MPEVIPAIIAKNFDELKEKIELVEQYVKWVQIDVMDGDFVPNTTWNNPEDLKQYSPDVFMEAHLMISQPEKHIEQWIEAGIKRIIFHIEATSNETAGDIVRICRDNKMEVGIAINPKTPQSSLTLTAGQAPQATAGIEILYPDMILVLGVTPGFGGQEFKFEVLEKIQALRAECPQLTIGVDGGMNPKTAKQAVDAGANIIVAGSHIYKNSDIKGAIEELRVIVKSD